MIQAGNADTSFPEVRYSVFGNEHTVIDLHAKEVIGEEQSKHNCRRNRKR